MLGFQVNCYHLNQQIYYNECLSHESDRRSNTALLKARLHQASERLDKPYPCAENGRISREFLLQDLHRPLLPLQENVVHRCRKHLKDLMELLR